MTRPTYGSLFSGVGGMDMGFDTHMDCVFQVEWDKHAQSILRRHWPDVPKWGDVQEVNGADLPPCDVLTFGSPCQDLSVAGKRAGLDGDRSSMFYEAVRIIKEMRDATNNVHPQITVWENVPGALSSNGGKDFGVVLDELAQLGAMAIEWRVLDAQHFGVPQRRRRVFVIAIFNPATAERCPNPLLPVPTGPQRDDKEDRYFTFYTSQGKYDRYTAGISTTLKTAGVVCITHPDIPPRRLMPIECERAMGWPDDHTRYTDTGKQQNDSNRYKQCGNGVVTPVAQWIAKQITPLLTGENNDI